MGEDNLLNEGVKEEKVKEVKEEKVKEVKEEKVTSPEPSPKKVINPNNYAFIKMGPLKAWYASLSNNALYSFPDYCNFRYDSDLNFYCGEGELTINHLSLYNHFTDLYCVAGRISNFTTEFPNNSYVFYKKDRFIAQFTGEDAKMFEKHGIDAGSCYIDERSRRLCDPPKVATITTKVTNDTNTSTTTSTTTTTKVTEINKNHLPIFGTFALGTFLLVCAVSIGRRLLT